MLLLSNDEIERLLSIEECMAALEPMYRDVAEECVLFSPRVDNIAPNSHAEGYYAFKHMGGTWPREKIQALRFNSDVVTHPLVAGKPRRVKQPLAPGGRWVGLVLLFSTETGALLAMFPDGVMQRLRVGATSGLGLRHLARPDAERSRFAPDYPTAKELGYPDLQFNLWFGLMTSSKVPKAIQTRLNAEVNKALQSPDLREKLAQQLYDPIGGTPERFAQAIRADMDRYGRAIKEAGIKPE